MILICFRCRLIFSVSTFVSFSSLVISAVLSYSYHIYFPVCAWFVLIAHLKLISWDCSHSRFHIPFPFKRDKTSLITFFASSQSSVIAPYIVLSLSLWCKIGSCSPIMLSITFIYVLIIIALETNFWSRPTSFNIIFILYCLSVMFPSQFIIIYSLFVYAYYPGFHITSGFVRYISYVPSIVASNGLEVRKSENKPCRKNLMRRSKLGNICFDPPQIYIWCRFLLCPWTPGLLISWLTAELCCCPWLVLIGYSWIRVCTPLPCIDTCIELTLLLLIPSPKLDNPVWMVSHSPYS